ncbi:MAG: YtxH domain-containing protein [Saprospiraceae bacterium]
MSSGKVFLGLLAGIAVGATLGILFAPEKGDTTRKKISKKSDSYAKELEEKFSDFVDLMAAKFDSLKEDAVHVAQKGKKKVDEAEAAIWDAKASVK